jgi:hypothetical protein
MHTLASVLASATLQMHNLHARMWGVCLSSSLLQRDDTHPVNSFMRVRQMHWSFTAIAYWDGCSELA